MLALVGTGIINYPFLSYPPEERIEEWNATTLEPKVLESLVNNKNCRANRKTFLACAAAVDGLGRTLGVIITPTGAIKKDWSKNIDRNSQRKRLEPWKNVKTNSVDFDGIIKSTFHKVEPLYHKVLVADGVNGFLSIRESPHTFIEPRPKKELLPGRDSILDDAFDLDDEDLELSKEEEETPMDLVLENLEDEDINILINQNLEEPSLLTIKAFKTRSCQLVSGRLKKANQKGVKKLVVDLQDNPGGFVDEVACIASLFLGPKEIVTLKYINKVQRKEIVWGLRKKLYEGDLKILVNENSASASEILSGAIQYYKRGEVIGARTYGKGSFQQTVSSPFDVYGARLRRTQGLYFFPNGFTPQLKGIEPDKTTTKRSSDKGEAEYLYPVLPEDVGEEPLTSELPK